METEVIRPIEVEIDGDNIIIAWDDGHRAIYPHRLLRLRCRCANCVEEMTGKARLDPDSVPTDVRAVDSMMIGSYAIQFLWSDAHVSVTPYQEVL